MRKRSMAIGIVLCLVAMLSAATAFEYRPGDIIYGGGGSIVNHVGLLVMGPDGDLIVHEAQIAEGGILLTSIEDFTARPYSSIIVIQVDGVSDEEAALAARLRSQSAAFRLAARFVRESFGAAQGIGRGSGCCAWPAL